MGETSAAATAKTLLADRAPARWLHVEQVACRSGELLADMVQASEVAVTAGWLHDVGYASEIASSGFHPLDGARFLRRLGWSDQICGLVAHHSCSYVEADRRGLGVELRAEFADVPGPVRDALWAADATTGPNGETLTLDERVAEVVSRYGEDHLVSECMLLIKPELAAAIARCEARLAHPTDGLADIGSGLIG